MTDAVDVTLIHQLLAGHFDLDTLVPGHPVPLRSLDVRRTHSMLGEVAEQLSDTVFLVGGEYGGTRVR